MIFYIFAANINDKNMDKKEERRSFWKEIWIVIIGTTISLVLTIGSSQLLEKQQRAEDRHLMAMMVMSDIESFAQTMEEIYEESACADTAAAWLMSLPTKKLELLPDDVMRSVKLLLNDATNVSQLPYDKITENIFSHSIDTWKNMNNVLFVENVGMCFSMMSFFSEYWNGEFDAYDDVFSKILQESDGALSWKEFTIKKLQSNEVRQKLANTHNLRCWLQQSKDLLRFYNYKNMALIGITEDELRDFIEERRKEIKIDMEEPDDFYYTPALDPDSLTTLMPLTLQIDSILRK